MREHYQKNKETIIMKKHQKINCPCGRILNYGNKSAHLKSNIHKQYMERMLVADSTTPSMTVESKPVEF
jgi:hypothetical protein